ncbi:Mitochondrial substrate carrier family protein E [Porphyridium purpureum]|uniref:Mitochondrial substrate carrier family protein E n=1 Tax=Porphyridium purpureum TaxID=35688 RepID=A0A5J4YW08_PORPP|nr:Mitochondrial substrate carrier family protein E [Porphyridium purpureum]|eukprot:POR0268..scf227_4
MVSTTAEPAGQRPNGGEQITASDGRSEARAGSQWVQLLFAAGTSGVVARSFVHPMDTMRAKMMAAGAGATDSARSLGLAHVCRATYLKEGMRGFYRGFGVTVTVQAPALATYLTSYDYAKQQLTRTDGLGLGLNFHPHSAWTHLACGLIAETISAVFWVPMEVVKQRVQVRQERVSSLAVLKDLLRYEGPSSLFRGYGLTVGVFGPYAMLYFMFYERMKLYHAQRNGCRVDQLSTGPILSSAAASAALSAAATTPLDVIKTRIQTEGDILLRDGGATGGTSTGDGHRNAAAGAASHPSGTRSSAASVMRRIIAEQGLRGMFRGLSARVLWISPQTAISMTCFETAKQWIMADKQRIQ